MNLPDCMMPDGADPCSGYIELRRERDELRAKLAELERQEPVASVTWDAHHGFCHEYGPPGYGAVQLYAHPVPPRDPMRLAEMVSDAVNLCWQECGDGEGLPNIQHIVAKSERGE